MFSCGDESVEVHGRGESPDGHPGRDSATTGGGGSTQLSLRHSGFDNVVTDGCLREQCLPRDQGHREAVDRAQNQGASGILGRLSTRPECS